MSDIPDQPFVDNQHAYVTGRVAAFIYDASGVELGIKAVYDVKGTLLPYLYLQHNDGWHCWIHIIPIPEAPESL